jgi:WD40 repeat protein
MIIKELVPGTTPGGDVAKNDNKLSRRGLDILRRLNETDLVLQENGWFLMPQLGHFLNSSGACWSPDGRRILTGGDDGTARVWDGETGRELLCLTGHASSIKSVAWSPNSTRILTGSDDKTARV